MKKLLFAFFLLLGSAGILNAQTPQTEKKVDKKTEIKPAKIKTTTVVKKSSDDEVLKAKKISKVKVHKKADGTPDKRYAENKKIKKVHNKKDGTPDMRYKVNKQ